MKRLLLSLAAMAAMSAVAQERTVENPDYETKLGAEVLSVTFGGDTTRLKLKTVMDPRAGFGWDSHTSLCDGSMCLLPIGAENFQYDKMMHTSKADSSLVYTLLFPHIDASTKSVTLEEPNSRGGFVSRTYYISNIQLQGESLAGRTMPEALKKKCLANGSKKRMVAPEQKSGVAVLNGKVYCPTPKQKEGDVKLYVNSPYTMTDGEPVVARLSEEGTWRMEVPLYVGSQMVYLHVGDHRALKLMLTAGEETFVYLDEYELGHMPESVLNAAVPAADLQWAYYDGANADINNAQANVRRDVALLGCDNWRRGRREKVKDLVEMYDLVMKEYDGYVGVVKSMGFSKRAEEIALMEARVWALGRLFGAKNYLVDQYYDRWNRTYSISVEERHAIWDAEWPEVYKKFIRESDLNNQAYLLMTETPYREMRMMFMSERPTHEERTELMREYVKQSNLSDNLKVVALGLVDNMETKDMANATDEEKEVVAFFRTVEAGQAIEKMMAPLKEEKARKAEKEYRELIGAKKEKDFAVQMYRISFRGDAFFMGDTLSAADLSEVAKTVGPEYVNALRMANDKQKVKLSARKTVVKANVNENDLGGELLLKLREKHPGKVLVLDFWATWCPGCVMLNDRLEEVKKDYADRDVVFVLLADETSPRADWERYANGVSGEHYRLTQKEADEARKRCGATRGYPSLIIVGKDGVIHGTSTVTVLNDLERLLRK